MPVKWVSGVKSLLQLEKINRRKPSKRKKQMESNSTDLNNISFRRNTVASSSPSLDSPDIETRLWEPSESCIQASASPLSAICMSVRMAECVCSVCVTHAECLCVAVCLSFLSLRHQPRSGVSTWQWIWMQPQLLWTPAPAESYPLDAGAALANDDVGGGRRSHSSPAYTVFIYVLSAFWQIQCCLCYSLRAYFDPVCSNISFLFSSSQAFFLFDLFFLGWKNQLLKYTPPPAFRNVCTTMFILYFRSTTVISRQRCWKCPIPLSDIELGGISKGVVQVVQCYTHQNLAKRLSFIIYLTTTSCFPQCYVC